MPFAISFPSVVLCLTFAVAFVPQRAAAQLPASFTFRTTTLRGDNFQSHNQKIVYTANGLFRSGQVQDGNTREIVERSTDGGATWSLLWDTGFDNRPPNVEADGDANVYVVYPDSGATRFLKFSASNSYASPVVNRLHREATSAAKFASFYDPGRHRVYHATQWGHLLTIHAANGDLIRSQRLFQDGGGAVPSYPHLFVDESGGIHYALTTADAGDTIPYETIRYIKSLDGGQAWRAMNGTPLSMPTTCAANGPSTMINLPGEVSIATWLANMHVKNGKVHFAYRARGASASMHYMRFDGTTGVREIDSSPTGQGWVGDTLRIDANAASFASSPADPAGPLYAVGGNGEGGSSAGDGSRLTALVSYDNGTTWHDYARSGSYSRTANPGLARAVTPEGKIIGCLATTDPWWATVNYFELPTLTDEAPLVDAGADQTIAFPLRSASLDGTVTDDGESPLDVAWSRVSGPGSVTFQDAGAIDTVATFSRPGSYVLRLTAADGGSRVSDDVRVVAGFIGPGSPMRLRVPARAVTGWTGRGFDDLAWRPALPGVGYDTDTADTYGPHIRADVESEMYDSRTTVYIRAPFWLEKELDPPAALTLRMKYDDGFVAYLNSIEIARSNAPVSPQWDSSATASHSDTAAVVFEDFDVSAFAHLLEPGLNVLAIQGLNESATSSDLLIVPELIPEGSFGSPAPSPELSLLSPGAPARATVPASAADGTGWTLPVFDDGAWRRGETGVGYETGAGEYRALLGIDVEAEMYQKNGSVYVRCPFVVAAPGDLWTLTLRMRYDDGFVAFLNGFEVARSNAPVEPVWSSLATASHSDTEAVVPDEFDVTAFKSALVAGANVLAIHGLNQAIDSSDLLILPELVAMGDPSVVPGGGEQVPGDCNQDGRIDISDGICVFGFLFLGSPSDLPCGDGSSPHPANRTLIDWQPDGGIDLSDGIGILQYLFMGGAPHPLGSDCVRIAGCPVACQ